MVGSGQGSAFLTPVVWLFIALLVAVPLLAIVRATVVDGTLDWSIGLALFLGVMCGAGLVLKGGAGFGIVFGVVLIGMCGAWPFVSHFSDRRNLKTLRTDDVERLRKRRSVRSEQRRCARRTGGKMGRNWALERSR